MTATAKASGLPAFDRPRSWRTTGEGAKLPDAPKPKRVQRKCQDAIGDVTCELAHGHTGAHQRVIGDERERVVKLWTRTSKGKLDQMWAERYEQMEMFND